MFPAQFDYHRPATVSEAVSLLQANPDAKVLAGGHSLLPAMKLRLAQPAALIDIGRIPELTGIRAEGGKLHIGALTTHAEIAAHDTVRAECAVLAEAAALVGDRQVRHRGTIGGNLAHADPASDLPAVALALDAVLHVTGPDGDRAINAQDFFVDLLTTDLAPEEILTSIELTLPDANSGSCYHKFEHPASGYAVCGVAAVVTLDGSGNCQSARLAFNGVAAIPFTADDVASALTGAPLNDSAIKEAVAGLAVDDPLSDAFASGEYRVELAKAMAQDALRQAAARASG